MAKINRITRSSSSLVTLAELQSGSELFTKTTIRKTQITPELTGTAALVKRAEVIRRVIDHIVYNDTVSGVQFFAEYLLPVDSPLLLFIRGRFVNDVVGLADDADLLPGKGFDEIVNTQEQSKLLVQFFRVFEDAALMQSRTALRLDKPLPADLVSTADLPSLEPGLNIFDVLQAQDISRLLMAFARTFEDAVIVEEDIQSFNITKSLLDDYAALDQSQLKFGKTLADLVAEFDVQSLVLGKALTDTAAINDALQRSLALVKADAAVFTDRQTLFVALTKTDTAVPVDVTLLLPGKSLVDLQDIADNAAKSVFKALADTIIPLDLAGVFDGITYSYGLSRAFDVAVSDVFRSATNYFRPLDDTVSLSDLIIVGQGKFRIFADLVSALDTNTLLFGLANRDTQTLSDAFARVHAAARSLQDSEIVDELKALSLNKALFDDISMQDLFLFELFKLVVLFDVQFTEDRSFLNVVKNLANSASLLDQFIIAQVKAVSDDSLVDEFKTMFIVKALADTAITQDLAGVFDGITYSYGLSRTETLLSLDDFSRVFSAQRIFEEPQAIDDEFRRVLGKNFFFEDSQDAPTDFIFLLPGIGVRDSVGDLTVYIDSLSDLLYDRELGQNFTSSLLFNAASATAGVQVTSSGTGAGQFEGFYAPAIPSVGPGTGTAAGGNYVLFTGTGTRTLATVPLDTTTGQNVVFTFIAGNTGNGGDRPEAGENLILEYSTNLGTSYTTTATIWTGTTLWPDGANWRTTSIAMPLASKTTSTIWRWRETGTPTDPGDNYGLFNIYVGGTSVVEIRTLPDTRFFNIGKALQDTQDQADSVRRAHTAIRGRRDGFDDVAADFSLIYERFITSYTTTVSTFIGTTSDAQLVNSGSFATYRNMQALTTTVAVLSMLSTNFAVRTTNAGSSWSVVSSPHFGSKFASDNLRGSTSWAVVAPNQNVFKSNNQGSSWVTNGYTAGTNSAEFYQPYWNPGTGRFTAFNRLAGGGGKSPSNYSWRYYYTDVAGNGFTIASSHIATTSVSTLADYPVGVHGGTTGGGSGNLGMVDAAGRSWALADNAAAGTAFTQVGALPGWGSIEDSSVFDQNHMAYGNNQWVCYKSNGVVWRSSSLAAWYSATLVGVNTIIGIAYDTSVSSFIVYGDTTADVPVVWVSTNAATWTSSSSISGGAVYKNTVFFTGTFMPGANTSGTSVVLAIETDAGATSIVRTTRYFQNITTTSVTSSFTNSVTPRFTDLPSSTVYNFDKRAKVGAVDIVTLKTIDPVRVVEVTSSSSVSLQVYTTSETTSLLSLTPSSGTFTNSAFWDSSVSVTASGPGTGTGSAGGFATNIHFKFDGILNANRVITTKYFGGVSSVSLQYIRGNQSNGGETPDADAERLVLEYNQFGSGSWVTANLIYVPLAAAGATWTTTSQTINLGSDLVRFRFRQPASSGTAADNYGLYDVSISGRTSVTTISYTTSFGAITGVGGTNSSVQVTRTADDTELLGTVDLFTRQVATSRTIDLTAQTTDAERADITKLLPPETVVPELGGVGQRIVSGFSSITTTTTSVTSSTSIQINAYTTSEIAISSMTGFPSGGTWANALIWDTSNQTQATPSTGFNTYDQFLFTTNAAPRHVTSKFLPGFSSVTIFYIAGGGASGGDNPEVGDNLILEYNQTGNNWTTAAVLRFGGSSTATSWTSTSISLSLGNDATRLRVRQTANSGTNTDQYAIGPTTVTGGRTSTLVTFATSVSVQTAGFGNYGSSVEVSEVAKDIDLRAYRGAVGSTPVKTIDGTVPIIDTTVTITVTSTQSDLTDGYLSSVVSDMVGSVVFDSANSIKANVVAAGTGEGSSGGFDTYRHVFFGGGSILSGTGRWITSNPLDLRDAEQITFQWIRGTGTNGRNSNSGSLPLYFQILPSPGLSTTAESTIYAGSGGETWTTRTINLSAAQRTSAALIRFRNDATVSNSDVPHVGLTNVRIISRTYSTSYSTSYGIAALLDWQQSSTTINRGARSIDDVGTIDNWSRILDVKRVYEDQSPALDQEFYSITKRLDDLVSIEDSYSVVTDGLTYDGTKFFNDNVPAGLGIAPRVSGSDVERTVFDVALIAKASVNYTVSSTSVLAWQPDQIFIGQQYTGAYRAGDGLERISLQPNLGEFETLLSGSGVDQTRGNDLERLTFNITQLKTEIAQAGFGTDAPGIRLHGDDLERTAFDITLRAYRGVDGSVTLNTIDPSPDVEFQVSSVTINRGARSVDDVGILDSFFLTYAVGRLPEDFISVGRNIDDGVRRFNPAINPETVVFAITKLIRDTATPDDFLQTFDGLTYRATMLERETVLAGLGIGPKVSGSDVERTPFDITMLMKQGANNTVSGVTIAATAQGETVRVGQQSFAGNTLGRRNSGDGQERISFAVTKLADAIVSQIITAGVSYDQRSTNEERVLFTVGKRATLGTDPVILGFGGTNFGARVSGDDLERTTFNVTLVMKQGANNTVSGVTRAASATGETVRVGQQYGLIRFSRDAQERIAFDYSKNLPAGSNNTTIVALDTVRPASAYRRPFEDPLSALGEKDGNFRYALTQGARIEDLTASDEIIISNLLFRSLESILQQGDLDPFGNINTMVSNGSLRMTDYVDIEYLENDYVGESRSFS